MNIITPLILIIISLGVFFGYVDPNYRGVDLNNGERSILNLQAEDNQYKKVLEDTTEIRSKREELMEKYNSLDPKDIERLRELLPDNIDNIKLVIDIQNIGDNRNLKLKNIKLDTAATLEPDKIGANNNKYGTVGLSFSVTASYDNFQNLLADLEKSRRLVEITDLSVSGNNTGLYDFTVGLKTYWLK